MRHLKTGCVSPQYHCIFGGMFETVYAAKADNWTLYDALSNLLWDSDRDQYAEEEYDADGMLVYTPPPLDKVWLTEPERRNREKRFREQHNRRERREEIQKEVIKSFDPPPTRPRRAPPEIIPDLSDVSDGDSSISSDSDSLGVFPESEGDRVWADHPERAEGNDDANAPPHLIPWNDTPPQINEEPQEPQEPTAPEPERQTQPRRNQRREPEPTQWERDEEGRLRRINFTSMSSEQFRSVKSQLSKAQKRQYYVSLCAKPEPHAARLSRKKLKFRQRRRLRQKEGDMMLGRMQLHDTLPTVEDIMASPLSRFITLAANDCGYRGSTLELVTTWVHPLFLKAKAEASKEDNPNWSQAMNGHFVDDYWKAAVKEIETLEGMEAWEVVDEKTDMNIIDSTWAFKLKRFPDGLIKKFKARFCARGDQQVEGVDFFETYAPVVQWTTIRLMLILEVLLDLKSKQGDVTADFLHADLDEEEEVYVRMPRGFRKQGKVLKLKKTLYGLRQSPRAFWKFMVKKMEECGMPQSNLYPCLFIGEKVICVMYVDDILFWAKDPANINALANRLRAVGVDLGQEGNAAGFLRVQMECDPETGLIEMKQEGLIQRVLEALGLEIGTVNGKATPAEGRPLVKDPNGEPPVGTFSYSSVVGMLLYLAGHTRPDIAYAVNSTTRYMFCPKKSHEEVLKRIGRYLKATSKRGLVLNPSKDKLKIDAYPDADFAGLYGHEEPTDPASVKSRTVYVITVADCPVLWQSKLQTETALSTMEAEIVALAQSCRELFPIMDMVSLLGPAVGLEVGETSMNVSIHEDYAGALILAETLPPQYTPRSKHYAIKTVWFREGIAKRGIKLLKISTIEQLRDIFTKYLTKVTFEYLRKRLMGW